MRIKLLLRCINSPFLTANYFYPLSAAVYRLLKFGSPEFSGFLHDIGYKLNNKSYKLFTYALRFEKFSIYNSAIKLISPQTHLFITSPLVDDFINNFVLGTFEAQKIEIADANYKTLFEISQVESLSSPFPSLNINIMQDEKYFRMFTPLILSTKRIHNGKLKPYYYRYNDNHEELNFVFNKNLRNKYEIITGKNAGGKNVRFEWDKNFIDLNETKGKRLTRKQTIKLNTKEETEAIGNLIPFTVKGDIDLIKVGYDCGFGEKNSLGFGMVENI